MRYKKWLKKGEKKKRNKHGAPKILLQLIRCFVEHAAILIVKNKIIKFDDNDNFAAEITPYLKRFAAIANDMRERIETKQYQRKK